MTRPQGESVRRAPWIALAVVLALGSSECGKTHSTPGEGAVSDVVTVKGMLTDEGVECPALRGEDGTLYTLSGSLGEFKHGDRVCVKGHRAEVSMCQQGITIQIDSIEAGDRCP